MQNVICDEMEGVREGGGKGEKPNIPSRVTAGVFGISSSLAALLGVVLLLEVSLSEVSLLEVSLPGVLLKVFEDILK